MAKSSAACRPARNGALISPGKKPRPVSTCCWAGLRWLTGLGPDQVLDRVVAEERGEQGGHRRQMGGAFGDGGRVLRGRSVRGAGSAGSDDISPTIIRVKKIPIERTWAEFWNVVFIPEPAPRCCAGRLFITPARLGEPKAAMVRPVKKSSTAKTQ